MKKPFSLFIKALKKSAQISLMWILAFAAVSPLAPVVRAQAGPKDWDTRGLGCTGSDYGGTEDASDVATIQGFACLVANVLSVFITTIGLAAFLMFIVASFRYLLSGGNSKNTDMARNTMTYAVVGIVVALSSFIILNLISSFTGVDVTEFVIPRATVNPIN